MQIFLYRLERQNPLLCYSTLCDHPGIYCIPLDRGVRRDYIVEYELFKNKALFLVNYGNSNKITQSVINQTSHVHINISFHQNSNKLN